MSIGHLEELLSLDFLVQVFSNVVFGIIKFHVGNINWKAENTMNRVNQFRYVGTNTIVQ